MNSATATDLLMTAYEIVGNDLDRRGCPKLADSLDKVMMRIAQTREAGPGSYIAQAIGAAPQASQGQGGEGGMFGFVESGIISAIINKAKAAHQSNGGRWDIVNQAVANNTQLDSASKQQLKQQWAQIAESYAPHRALNPAQV